MSLYEDGLLHGHSSHYYKGGGPCSRPTTIREGGPCSRPTTIREGGPCSRPTTIRGGGPCSRPTTIRGGGPCSRPTTIRGGGPCSRPTTIHTVVTYKLIVQCTAVHYYIYVRIYARDCGVTLGSIHVSLPPPPP